EQLLGQVWMALPLLVKVGEVWHRQHGRASPWWPGEQGSLQPIFVPILPKRPRDSRRFGSLQILMDGSESNRATAGDLPQPQAHVKLQSKNFFDLAHGLCSREHNPCEKSGRSYASDSNLNWVTSRSGEVARSR